MSNQGYRVTLNMDDVESINLRVLTQTSAESRKVPFITPAEQRLELIFFRDIFVKLREQLSASDVDTTEYDAEKSIPTEEFQRAFERLFYVLKDGQGFNAKVYDQDGNGQVGWGEFCFVFKKRKVTIRLTVAERIFLTFDDPDSSLLAQVLSIVVLLVIVTSSFVFILGTLPECQEWPDRPTDNKPEAYVLLSQIERGCLWFFIVEYLMRVFTCAGVRAEVFDRSKLLQLAIGYETIKLPSNWYRLFKFLRTPANVIDLAAILPGVIGMYVEMEGGGFVVLRLIRLTRVFRALRFIKGPAAVIARTIQQSTTALYVLAFNLLLGIVIAGSLMYLAEGGVWDKDEHAYLRPVGLPFWNDTGGENDTASWVRALEPSPFQSIPHSFWWAIVTATTVGYGDQYPTSTMGYVIAVATMLWSLVILALPVGVIGGTFSQVWQQFETEKRNLEESRRREMESITSAIQHFDPSHMNKLMVIEVWNERFPKETHNQWGLVRKESKARPSAAEFMGQCWLDLDLSQNVPITKRVTLPLREDSETVDRTVTGSVTIEYEWTPRAARNGEETCWTGDDSFDVLLGNLKVTLLHGDKLVNLDLCSPKSSSNPFCTVLCYPTSPKFIGDVLLPCIWRGPTRTRSLAPQWNASHVFEFAWTKPKDEPETPGAIGVANAQQVSVRPGALDTSPSAPATEDAAKVEQEAKIEKFVTLLQDMGKNLEEVQESIHTLTGRVDRLNAKG